jgi:hypothetical protein
VPKIEVQAALIERVNRYCAKRGVSSINDAAEALINIGLFIDAAPNGSVLVRRDDERGRSIPDIGSNDDIEF